MTSGVIEENLSVLSAGSCNTKGRAFRKSWSGVNGKTPIPYPYSTKWNSWEATYNTTHVDQRCIQFYCSKEGGGTDTYASTAPTAVWGSFGSVTVPDNTLNAALSRIVSSAKGHSWNAGVSAAEAKRTTDMCVGNLQKLGRSMLALKRGDFSTALRQLGASPRTTRLKPRDISGRWLEMQYGWLPLLSDVHEAAKAFESVSKGPKSVRFTATASATAEHNFGGYGATDGKITQVFKRSFRYTFEQIEEMGVARQLGLEDPLSVAWELIPYSFVVDWFIPIGTYLSNLNQVPALSGRWMLNTKLGTDGGCTLVKGTKGSYPACLYHGGSHLYDDVKVWPVVRNDAQYYRRDPIGGPKVPAPNLNNLVAAFSPRRLYNAIALAHQRFR